MREAAETLAATAGIMRLAIVEGVADMCRARMLRQQ